jgi:REP element-mobilizing transposase RayT
MIDSQKKNAYDPKKHHRKSRRLKEYDYSKSGLYFITLLCEKRIHRFGQIKNGKMQLNECGQIAFDEWVKLPERFSKFKMNVFQIMPDHFHSIIELVGKKEPASLTAAPIETCLGRWYENDSSASTKLAAKNQNKNIADIISAYKSLVFNACLNIYKAKNKKMGRLWHRNYYERIIRNKLAYTRISNYIINNPSKWTEKKG